MLLRVYTTSAGNVYVKSSCGKTQALKDQVLYDAAKAHAQQYGYDNVKHIPSWHGAELFFVAEKAITKEKLAKDTLFNLSNLDYLCQDVYLDVFRTMHRTEQQSLVRNIIHLLKFHGLRFVRGDYDLRNEASVKKAYELQVKGDLDGPIPYV
jgi:hypothetical protein